MNFAAGGVGLWRSAVRQTTASIRYNGGNRRYWELLDKKLEAYAAEAGLDYVTNDDSMRRPFGAPPVMVNYFYHEQIKKSARKGGDTHA